LAYLLVIASFVFINCGNEPPEDFYDGTPADDSAIVNLLNAHPDLLETEDLYAPSIIGVSLPAVSFPVADSYYRNTNPIIKQHVDSIALELTASTRFQDLWYAKDTTCTVYLWDTFTVIGSIHWDKKYSGYYDSITVGPGGDTLKQLKTVNIDSTGGMDEISGIAAEGLRHLFFECKRDSTLPETLDGKIVYPIKDPREWQLKRISYGSYYFPNRGAERPTILTVFLQKGTDIDTIYSSNTDTLYAGHVMNRFRSVDSLLQYTDGDSVIVTVNLSTLSPILSGDCAYYVVFDGKRYQLANGTGTVVLDAIAVGIHNFYIEVVANAALSYIDPPKDYQASVWLIPIDIQ
jgi:hypothetical protein